MDSLWVSRQKVLEIRQFVFSSYQLLWKIIQNAFLDNLVQESVIHALLTLSAISYSAVQNVQWKKPVAMNCKVCQRPGVSQTNHYGSSFICHSCRGFFYRSVQNSAFNRFGHKSHPCVIDSVARKSCRKCRFEKCLQVGMRISFAAKPGMYLFNRFSEL